jgi:hypothetical protein
VPVVADPEAVSFIAEHGGSLYVYTDPSGPKHVTTEARKRAIDPVPADPAGGFLVSVEEGIEDQGVSIRTLSRQALSYSGPLATVRAW